MPPTLLRVASFAAVVAAARSAPAVGNAWHIPEGAEPGIASMRDPIVVIGAGTTVRIYTGNQFQGPAGNPGNQLQTGSTLFYRKAKAAAFQNAPLLYDATSGNNKYYKAEIPGGTFSGGEVVEYYLRIAYSDQVTTYLHGDDAQSFAVATEPTAQAAPFTFSVEWPLAPSGPYLSLKSGAFEARVYQGSGHVTLSGPDLGGTPGASTVTLAPARARLSKRWFYIGKVLGSSVSGSAIDLTQALGDGSVKSRVTFPAEGVMRYEVVDWNGLLPTETAITGPAAPDEHFYGFGEKFNSLDQAQKRVHILTSDHPGNKGDHAYKVAPWFLSTAGYGIRLDSSAESWFDMRATYPDRWVAENQHPSLRVDVVAGPRLPDAISRYTGLTGRPPLPPPWVFGGWMSSDHWRDGGEIRYVVSRFKKEKIPRSVFVFDSPWETAYNDFTWNMAQFSAGGTYEGTSYPGFASVGEMMSFLRANGFKVVVWMTPFVNVTSNDEGVPGQNLGKAKTYDEAAAAGHFVHESPGGPPLVVTWWKGQGSPIDFTSAAARAWVKGQLDALVAESGGVIGGFKTDDGEADFIPTTAVYADGRTGIEMRNGYAFEYHKAIFGVLGAGGLLFARSGFTGTQAFPAGWAGDNEPNFGDDNGLPSVIVAGQSAAMSGHSIWGHDIGGYQDTNPSLAPDDLFRRWTQFGALSPIMQMHRQVGAGKQYPWSYGPGALANYVTWSRLHTKLFPYIYTYAKVGSETGLPIIRPLVLMHQTDPATHGVNHTYHFGDELLVAPVIQPNATTRDVYLPAGAYRSFWTGELFQGGKVVTWESANPTQMPLFVREGAIIPMLRDDPDTLCDAAYVGDPAVATPTDALEFAVYPGEDGSFTVYDGTALASHRDGAEVSLALTSKARPITLRILHEPPAEVDRDGAPIPMLGSAAELAAADLGWIVEGGYVLVKLVHAGGASTVVLRATAGSGSTSSTSSGGPSTVSSDGGGAGTGGGSPSPPADAGCGCRLGEGGEERGAKLVLAAGVLAAARRARRRRK